MEIAHGSFCKKENAQFGISQSRTVVTRELLARDLRELR
jgi:hypothetical protein